MAPSPSLQDGSSSILMAPSSSFKLSKYWRYRQRFLGQYDISICRKGNSCTPTWGRVIGPSQGLEECKHPQINSLQIEWASLVLVSSVQQAANMAWDLMHIWRNTIEILTSFHTWTIRHCKRLANTVADELAKLEFSVVNTFQAFLLAPIQDLYLQEQAKDTRPFYFHADLYSDNRQTANLISHDSHSFAGCHQNGLVSRNHEGNRPLWFLIIKAIDLCDS